MRASSLETFLNAAPFMADVPLEDRADLLLPQAERRFLAPGDPLLTQGEAFQAVTVITSGTVRIRRQVPGRGTRTTAAPSNPVVVVDREVSGGYILDRFGLVYEQRTHTCTAVAVTPVEAWRIPVQAFDNLFFHYPQARSAFIPWGIVQRLRTFPLTGPVDRITLGYLAEQVVLRNVDRDQVLYRPEDPAQHLYLIHRGQVHLRRLQGLQPEDNLWLGTGNACGFPGLLRGHRGDRYGHIAQVTTPSQFYQVPWATIRQMARRWPHMADPRGQLTPWEALSTGAGDIFQGYEEADLRKLAGFCSHIYIPHRHLLILQGDLGDSLWVLYRGEAVLSGMDMDNARPRTPVQAPIYFNDEALVASINVPWTVEAQAGSCWLRLHWQDFQRYLQIEAPRDRELRSKLRIHRHLASAPEEARQRQSYPWLAPGEFVVTLHHRHWLELLLKMRVLGSMFLLAGPIMLVLILFTRSIFWTLASVGFLLLVGVLWGVVDYLNDFFVVTNQRIIQQEKMVFISEHRREALLEQIQQVDVHRAFWGRLLGYGTLLVQTAGATQAIRFNRVPHPDALKATIFRWRTLRLARYRAESRAEIQDELERRLGQALDLPSRVRAYEAVTHAPETEGRSLWQRIWDYLMVESRLKSWETVDHVVWRKHWMVLVPKIFVPLLITLMVAGVLTLEVAISRLTGWLGPSAVSLGLTLATGLTFFALLLWVIYLGIDWWNDTYELTRDRIIDVERWPLGLKEHRREAELAQVQDVTLHMPNPIHKIFNYGNVVVRTAAQAGEFTFDSVPNPHAVREEIFRRLVEWRRREERLRARERARELPDWFEIYHRLEGSS